MKKLFKQCRLQQARFNKLVTANRVAVEEYNNRMVLSLLLLGAGIFPILMLVTPFSNTKQDAFILYVAGMLFCVCLWLLYRLPSIKKHAIFGMYSCFAMFFMMSIYLSVFHSPNMRATVLLSAFCTMPLIFIDKPIRIILFTVFWFSVHTILAAFFKPLYVLDDVVNTLCFAILGCFLGNNMLWTRLQNFDTQRLLIIEKETDVLTGLYNRRKLFEVLAQLQAKGGRKPTGAMMLDIDYFKALNDKNGHIAGDKCLSQFGEVLRNCAKTYPMDSFRYGGDEFIVLAYDSNQEDLRSLAQAILEATRQINVSGDTITVSIGVTYLGDEQVPDYESIINPCDMAAYQAKEAGRNCAWVINK
jgi:diguanylate cyclase (GGDEF)-like protein